ncbi:MAG: hypothetical protein WCH34_08735 [Bacteroidota bacterium]
MSKTWSFISNVFLILVGRSLKRFYKLSFFLMEALQSGVANPKIAAIYNDLLPYYTAFKAAFVDWKSKFAIRKGDTIEQNNLFNSLHSLKIPDWHRRVSVKYAPKSTQYTKIFPQGISPFSILSMEEQLIYFDTVITNIALFSDLDDVKDEMVLFRASIETARNTQKQSDSQVKAASDTAKELGASLADEIYGSLGLLMGIFRKTPKKILEYFNVSLLRYRKKASGEIEDLYELLFAAEEIKEGGFSFSINEKLMLYNSGNTTLRCWFAKLIGDPLPSNYFDIAPDAVLDFEISKYANQTERFFMIKNLSTTDEGSIEIEKE